MLNEKLFTAIHIPNTPIINGIIKPNNARKYNFKLVGNHRIADTLYHFVYEKNEKRINSYLLRNDPKDKSENYLFVENNELYDDFISQFGGIGQRYWESFMDVYLNIDQQEEVFNRLTNAYNNSFYEEDEPTPLCHIYGQQAWHDDAYIIANRIALIELREAIDIALKHGEKRIISSPADEEGYELFIKCVDDDFDWEEIELPYHDRECYVPEEPTPRKVFKKYKF